LVLLGRVLLVTALVQRGAHPLLEHIVLLLVAVAAVALVMVGLVALEPQVQEAVAHLTFLGRLGRRVVLPKVIQAQVAVPVL
jgi:hypothetical protein